ncbi:hypothetical protein M2337_002792 [Sphingobium sp. B2D3A]|uniref:hypothetical protein n=1 Tax=Sphingobium TaxID=165695 RepID=UPI0015EC3B08|nr:MULTISPECIES: hypothetical protein [Sphingobium]MCW2338559.1 hypothetical protein [Sphingobium sp. B2D3A]MCW2349997.1 hypothetical protein [Sphingobium sp. B12D2B]MCW2361334.1 hypothetical protein [Sphingobium sp. B10D3B]MCW2366860.1 hypothetical protein [Sphingobium sp. B7D2B]MCW2369098.1 hypothetical protein [Sphingobium sp. B11D3D]
MRGDATPVWLHILVLSLAGMVLIVLDRMADVPDGVVAGLACATVYFWLTFGAPAYSKRIRENG